MADRTSLSAVPVPGFTRARVVVEHVRPEIDGGRFPIKRVSGDTVVVTAHAHTDGHDDLRVVLRHRRVPPDDAAGAAAEWRELPMTALGNDEWEAQFPVVSVGVHEYQVVGWIDRFATWRKGLVAKSQAGQDVSSELLEGAALVRETAAALPRDDAAARRQLETFAKALGEGHAPESRLAAALDDDRRRLMLSTDRPAAPTASRVLRVTVERPRARFGAWYEMFPRSAGTRPGRGATFAEAEARLADIAALGFDVVYLPPIHPIGRSFRKGPNNTLVAGPGDPGSPWAIGSDEGGHMSVDPELGTLADFDRFVAAAAGHGLEIALDIAFQCSPDHPYVREHPEWFKRRPDGTIKYAENPPKKYQDIYPFDFDSPAAPALWEELGRVVQFWVNHGVRIFRVDNPHTKPYPFWEWLIDDIRRRDPEVIFLSEAFTRPKRMYYLAKLGFSQSYSYFTWRNTKEELTEYFTTLTRTEVSEILRPNLFANTPDILHAFLQQGGQAPFQIRLILAATLGATYGIYSGFELCEHEAVPGTEEYLHSEKYEIRVRDWNAPGNIKPLVRRINRIRRDHPALHADTGLTFFPTDNPHVLGYAKIPAAPADAIITLVNLDPVNMQHGHVHLPLDAFGLPWDARFDVEDLLDGARYTWEGPRNYVRLDPQLRVAHVLRLRRDRA